MPIQANKLPGNRNHDFHYLGTRAQQAFQLGLLSVDGLRHDCDKIMCTQRSCEFPACAAVLACLIATNIECAAQSMVVHT